MGSSETIFSHGSAGNSYRFARTISVPTSQNELTLISLEIVALPLDDRKVCGDESQIEGEWLLWLIVVIYLLLVFALYFGLYIVLKAFSV